MQQGYVVQYERLEREHWWWQARLVILYRLLVRLERDRLESGGCTPGRVLDVGCGPGVTLAYLRRAFGFQCIGVEPNEYLAQQARVNTGETVYAGDMRGAPLADAALFDYILFLDTLEHIRDDADALRTVRARLAVHGKLVINVPALPWLWSAHDEMNHHWRRYRRTDLLSLLRREGFGVVFVRYWASLPVLGAYAERLVLWRGRRARNYHVWVPPRVLNVLARSLLLADYRLGRVASWPFGMSLLVVADRAAD